MQEGRRGAAGARGQERNSSVNEDRRGAAACKRTGEVQQDARGQERCSRVQEDRRGTAVCAAGCKRAGEVQQCERGQ